MKVSAGTMPVEKKSPEKEMTTDPKIVNVFEQLVGEGIGGFLYYQGFKEFREYQPANSIFLQFVIATRYAYLAATLLALSNLLKSDRSVCINYLFNLCKEDGILPDEEIETDREALNTLREEARPFITLRDKVVAHVDRRIVTNAAAIQEMLGDISFDAIEPLYQRVHLILQKYGMILLDQSYADFEIPLWLPTLEELFKKLDQKQEGREDWL